MWAAIPFPNFDPALVTFDAFTLFGMTFGPFPIRWYALAYIAGLLLGWRLIVWLLRRDALWPDGRAPMAPEKTDDLLLWATLGVVGGGRLGYVLFYEPQMLWNGQVFRIWEGGMAFHGGMLGVIVAVAVFAYRTKTPMLSLGDAVACATPIGLFFGRIANFINGELWGRPTEVPWGVIFEEQVLRTAAQGHGWLLEQAPAHAPRHPSQLYEAATEGAILFGVLMWFALRTDALKRPGFCTGVFLVGYGVARAVCEIWRQPDITKNIELLGLEITRGQVLCLPMIAAGAAFIYVSRRRAAAAAA